MPQNPKKLVGACLVGQSGGPSSVINSSALGVIQTALKNEDITAVYGAAYGIKGVLADRLYDLGREEPEELELLKHTPSSALGSCRYKLKDSSEDDTDYQRILEVFRKHNIRYFFYIGGNDSMDTCNKISKYMQKSAYECRIMGIPKTIDNDLFGTDHCPGYASAAKYIATSFMELSQDVRVYDSPMVCVVEIMGRHAGWLAAASSLASAYGCGPDLIYLPERTFDMEKFLEDVQTCYLKQGFCMVAASEGIRYADGSFVSEIKTGPDSFGHAQLGGLAHVLTEEVRTRLGVKTRGIELSLLQRCASHVGSGRDIDEAYLAGSTAVIRATAGETDRMVAFECERRENSYICRTKMLPLEEVANYEKKVPQEWINEEGNFVTSAFVEYARPLIQGDPEIPRVAGLPRFARLKKYLVED